MFSALIISSRMENVLSISHLREYMDEYSLLRSMPILRFTDRWSVTMPLLLLVSIMGMECVLSDIKFYRYEASQAEYPTIQEKSLTKSIRPLDTQESWIFPLVIKPFMTRRVSTSSVIMHFLPYSHHFVVFDHPLYGSL